MSNMKYDSIVSQSEITALKEIIFNRARTRAQSITDEVQNTYTDIIHNDIMEIARDSFSRKNNPFSEISTTSEPKNINVEEKRSDIGFKQKNIENIKSRINYRIQTVNEQTANNTIESAMNDASKDFRRQQSFMGALNFLNSQASIAIITRNGQGFNAIA